MVKRPVLKIASESSLKKSREQSSKPVLINISNFATKTLHALANFSPTIERRKRFTWKSPRVAHRHANPFTLFVHNVNL